MNTRFEIGDNLLNLLGLTVIVLGMCYCHMIDNKVEPNKQPIEAEKK
jgi:hypothetical protein